MIFIVLEVRIRPDRRQDWLAGIQRYTETVRQEEGNLSFDCYESLDTPDHFAVVEGFESRQAGEVHVQSDHFKDFMTWFPDVIAEAPKIVNTELPGEGWSTMSELG
jgi:quinol monooxygenase YgiN